MNVQSTPGVQRVRGKLIRDKPSMNNDDELKVKDQFEGLTYKDNVPIQNLENIWSRTALHLATSKEFSIPKSSRRRESGKANALSGFLQEIAESAQAEYAFWFLDTLILFLNTSVSSTFKQYDKSVLDEPKRYQVQLRSSTLLFLSVSATIDVSFISKSRPGFLVLVERLFQSRQWCSGLKLKISFSIHFCRSHSCTFSRIC